jgi:hypothetical protein
MNLWRYGDLRVEPGLGVLYRRLRRVVWEMYSGPGTGWRAYL